MYIRTKDGVYEVVGFDEECIIPSMLIKVKNYGKERITHCCKGDIINQSENLEELCDVFFGEFVDGRKVILEKWNGNKFVIRWATNMVSMIKDLNKTYTNVKGAIYTDKGLIYVAKMNDKGELELI